VDPAFRTSKDKVFMELTLSKQSLASALSRTTTIADRKSSMQILSNVLISAEGATTVQLAATDLNVSVSGTLPARVVKGGSITLPAKTLYDVVRALPEGEVTLRSRDESVEITSGRAKFKLLGLPSEDFPRMPDSSGVEFVAIDAGVVLDMIERTSFSISSDEMRPHLNGALFQGDGKVLRMVTTDGHRLSKAEYKIEESGFYNFSLIVPNRGVQELRRLLDVREGQIQIGTSGGSMFVRREVEIERAAEGAAAQIAEFVMSSKLVEAEFPPYDQVIPRGLEKNLVASRGALLEALRRVSVVSAERTLGVKLSLSEGALEVSTDNPSVGESSELVDVSYEGAALEIGFNARYFVDVLGVLDDEEVHVELSGPLDPAVVRDAAGCFVGVIMPIRI
jgi:DNA polymerase-3 subunit beta